MNLFKSLTAVIALLGVQSVEARSQVEMNQEGIDLVKGFLDGTVLLSLDKQDGISKECAQYVSQLYTLADGAFPRIFAVNLHDKAYGIGMIAKMMRIIQQSLETCQPSMDINWDKVSQIADAWENEDEVYASKDELIVHGIDITYYLNTAVSAYGENDYVKVGQQLGRASIMLLAYDKLLEIGVEPDTINPQMAYWQIAGAEYAKGFLYAAKAGIFDDKMLYECIKRSKSSFDTFKDSNIQLITLFYTNEWQYIGDAYYGMIKLITNMVLEEQNGDKVCPELTADPSRYIDLMRIIEEMQDPDTMLVLDYDRLKFNGYDITDISSMWIESYPQGDFKKLGFLFGDILYRNSLTGNDNDPELML